MEILVVCGAGASSTFVAQRLRRAAQEAGLDWNASAGTEQAVSASPANLILVGPHLAGQLDAIRTAVDCPVAVLPDDIFADRHGVRALTIAQSALSSSAADTSSET